MFKRTSLIVTLLLVTTAALARANDAYYDVFVRDLKLVEGKLPKPGGENDWRHYERTQAMRPYALMDGSGEAYLSGPDAGEYGGTYVAPTESSAGGTNEPPALRLHLRAPEGQEVKGRLVLVNSDRSGMVALRFVVPASAAKAEAKVPFLHAKESHFNYLLNRDIPGGAWFRHQARVTQNELNVPASAVQARPFQPNFRQDELSNTYDIFTGGRAISENLQLDRVLPQRTANETPVKIDSIAGITIKEIDWKPLIKDARPALDPLAEKIPFDQHAVFFPSFQAALAVADETKKHDTPILRLAEPRAEDAGVVEWYQRQLGLPLSTLARTLGPALVKSVALTGSDPSFPLGTDVAVLFETSQPALLAKALGARIQLAAAEAKVEMKNDSINGVPYLAWISPGRKMSSYIAPMGNIIIVTNSLYQLDRLSSVHSGKEKSLAQLPEYNFFRIRYPRTDADESALVFLSDATIRRWCGPKWRIADSRRTRARAVLDELQAGNAGKIMQGNAAPGPIYTDLPVLGGGELRLGPDGVNSSVYGSLDFMTPIGELPLDEVTKQEADAYAQWRDGYQRNWTWAFDPIGLRIGIDKKKLAADLTITPLIMNSEYDMFMEVSKGASFAPTAGDPHQALAQFILSLNHESRMFHQGEGLLALAAAGKSFSLGWIGSSVSVYTDDDPFWADLAKADEKKLEQFIEKNAGRLPIAVRIESTNPLQLAMFLASARAYIEQTGPGLTTWESLKYKDQGYVRISPAKGQPGMMQEIENVAVYYTTVDGALTVTLSENVLQHAIDRAVAKMNKKPEAEVANTAVKKPQATKNSQWLGSNLALHVDHRILEVANALEREEYQDRMQVLSWSNLPILNEWKRLFPDRDPVAVHRELWGVTLVCPGGGKYVWNEKYGTMESTVYGHPGQPKAGPPAPPVLSTFKTADFGLTLENDGLRARVELRR